MSIQQTSTKMESKPVEEKPNIQDDVDAGKDAWLQARYLVAFAAFLLNAVFYMKRVVLSVTIVAIALDTEHQGNAPHYDWDATQRSMVLSSFFWGYTAMQMVAIRVVHKFGPRRVGFSMGLVSSVINVLFVPAASLGWQGACAARALLGMSQAGLIGSVHQLLGKWSPPNERGRMVVYSYCGQQLGTILALSGSGVISEWIGWPWVFYCSGALGLLVAAAWVWLVADTPAQHRWTSPKERKYIESSLASAQEEQQTFIKKKLKTPWRAVLTSAPFWSLVMTQCAQGFGFWTLLTGIPSYMSGVLHFDLAQDGLLSSLPYLAMWVTGLLLAWVSDALLRRGFWSVGVSRKIGNSIGQYGCAVALVVLSFSKHNPTTAVTILTVAVGLNAGAMVGASPNMIDLAPNFVATLAGLTNQAACIMAIVGPLLIGLVVTDNSSAEQWRIVFLITAAFYVVGNSLFVLLGSGKEQPWNNPDWRRVADTEIPPAEKSSEKQRPHA